MPCSRWVAASRAVGFSRLAQPSSRLQSGIPDGRLFPDARFAIGGGGVDDFGGVRGADAGGEDRPVHEVGTPSARVLLAFLQQMPKGGDLHIHLSGAIYAESMIDWASENALCVDRSTSKLIRAACDSCEPYKPKPSIRCAYQDQILYDQLVDAWSMRNWHREEESGHDHFFATFEKFGPAMDRHAGEALAEVASRGRRRIICNTWR